MRAKIFIAQTVCLFLILSCSAQEPLLELQLDTQHKVLLLDSAEAAHTINIDNLDGFFDKVTLSEMSIQMKKPLGNSFNRKAMVEEYRSFLRTDVEDFTYEESKFMADIMEEVYKTAAEVSSNIFPKEVKLIKTKGAHYGNSVFYTREDCIVIPENELEDADRKNMTSVMFHELFHIYSRLNPTKSTELYSLIGFENVGWKNLQMPETLAERVFFNPDGVNFAQKIKLTDKTGRQFSAVPIIYSNNVGFKKETPEFFSYLEFNLFEVVEDGGKWKVVVEKDGVSSTLDLKNIPDFFRQIKDNTHYIIHPDEVLADNFSFIMMGKKEPAIIEKFKPEGKQLISDIELILKGKSVVKHSDIIKPDTGNNKK